MQRRKAGMMALVLNFSKASQKILKECIRNAVQRHVGFDSLFSLSFFFNVYQVIAFYFVSDIFSDACVIDTQVNPALQVYLMQWFFLGSMWLLRGICREFP